LMRAPECRKVAAVRRAEATSGPELKAGLVSMARTRSALVGQAERLRAPLKRPT
jgi:hypothetical protein